MAVDFTSGWVDYKSHLLFEFGRRQEGRLTRIDFRPDDVSQGFTVPKNLFKMLHATYSDHIGPIVEHCSGFPIEPAPLLLRQFLSVVDCNHSRYSLPGDAALDQSGRDVNFRPCKAGRYRQLSIPPNGG